MTYIVALIGLLIVAVSLYGLVSPSGLIQLAGRMNSTPGLWIAAGLRVLFGVALWVAAPASRAPTALQIFAGIAVIAGVALPIIGLARFGAILDWWTKRPAGVVQGWAIFALAFGAWVLWAAFP